ncbi:MAG: AMP-binding protein [bacterium]|nr:AMP-binding protein [bacterium]
MNKHKEYNTLTELIMHRRKSDKGITFIQSSTEEQRFTYAQLHDSALNILANLQKKGIGKKAQLVFQLKDNIDTISTFWACLLGNITPVPITLGTTDEYRLKLFNAWKNLDSPYLITDKVFAARLEQFARDYDERDFFMGMEKRTVYMKDVRGGEQKGEIHIPSPSDIAYIQFSSGSTDAPKGVVLTHKNLLINCAALSNAFGPPESGEDRYFSWMPLTHDLGMIGYHLTPLLFEYEHALMSSLLFIRYPFLWLQKMSRLRSTITCSPNFGYKYVLKHVDIKKSGHLDLSAVRVIINGAEPISMRICREFSKITARWGLRETAITPAYGMAEACLIVTLSPPKDSVNEVLLDRNTINFGQKVREEATGRHSVSFVEVGMAVRDCAIKIGEENGDPLPEDVIGNIFIKGPNVTSGYHNNPQATERVFAADGWLRTGDLGFVRNDKLVITGRAKDIIFQNGQNFYPHDLERVVCRLPEVDFEKAAFGGVFNPDTQAEEIFCFIVFKRNLRKFPALTSRIRAHILQETGLELSAVIPVKKIPKTTSGKLQRYLLTAGYLVGEFDAVLKEIEELRKASRAEEKPTAARIRDMVILTWREVLQVQSPTENDNFFDLGGDSKRALQVKGKLQERLGISIDDTALFKYPTISGLSAFLAGDGNKVDNHETLVLQMEQFKKQREAVFNQLPASSTAGARKPFNSPMNIAVIGMSGRFPGAPDIDSFLHNLQNGVESLSIFTNRELSEAGIDAADFQNPDYVKTKGIIESAEYFDATFFGYTPVEVEKMDPQMRLLHECSWTALENAGYYAQRYPGLVGVYIGAAPNPHWESRFPFAGQSMSWQFVDTQLVDKDFSTTRLSYKLNLKGPGISLYSACSTSLAAIDLACRGLMTGTCDMALAGGVSLSTPMKSGYLYEDGMLFSRDGHNRTFDRDSDGTVFSDGVGIVVLKRLSDALADGDTIAAVIKGSAMNNDGSRKIGYTAPALEGQAEVTTVALQAANVSSESIGHIEAHGTATTLGDPLEIDALTLAFNTSRKGYCAIGSVKSNIGHLNVAAGVAGFIKTVLSLQHRLLFPSINYTAANPQIDFQNSPFYVNTGLRKWSSDKPLRAGVSAFGIGGTNVHVVMEEAPRQANSPDNREYKLLLLSARSAAALDTASRNLAAYLDTHSRGLSSSDGPPAPGDGVSLEDVAYTLQIGRKAFKHRQMLVCSTAAEAAAALTPGDTFTSPQVGSRIAEENQQPLVFMFSGLGDQYEGMGGDLYSKEPLFREAADKCFDILRSYGSADVTIKPADCDDTGTAAPCRHMTPADLCAVIKSVIFTDSPPASGEYKSAGHAFETAQLSVFILEYALAQLLMGWGLKPDAVIGYSFGEYTAACIAGVFSLQDTLDLIIARGRLVAEAEDGSMLSVPMTRDVLEPLVEEETDVAVAIDNGPTCIVSGSVDAVKTFGKKMKQKGCICLPLSTTHAIHSPMMAPLLGRFEKAVINTKRALPTIPFISNVTGTRVRGAELLEPAYWCRHLRGTVRFSEGLRHISETGPSIFLEIGPGRALCALLVQHVGRKSNHLMFNLIQPAGGTVPAGAYLLNKIGHLWMTGVSIRWESLYTREKRRRVPLPTYPFEGIHIASDAPLKTAEAQLPQKQQDVSRWFYRSVLQPLVPTCTEADSPQAQESLLFFLDNHGLGRQLVGQLREEGHNVFTVTAGEVFLPDGPNAYTLDPSIPAHYQNLVIHLLQRDRMPPRIVHLWSITGNTFSQASGNNRDNAAIPGFYSLLFLSRALGKCDVVEDISLLAISDHLHDIAGEEIAEPWKATVLAACTVIPQEYSNIKCRSIDITLAPEGSMQWIRLARYLSAEIKSTSTDAVTAYREGLRWIRNYVPVSLPEPRTSVLKQGGVYWLIGGLGGIGYEIAKHLARQYAARIILTGRTAIPPQGSRDQWLSRHPENDPVSNKIRKIRELETLGAQLLVLEGDLADRERMREILQVAEINFGTINGIFHCAGSLGADSFITVDELDAMQCRGHFQAKVYGLSVLKDILGGRKPDFCLLMSSISSVLGGLGHAAYAAANLFMDSFAAGENRTARFPWLTVNWDGWRIPGEEKNGRFVGADWEKYAMTVEEGLASLERVLAQPDQFHLVHSTGNLLERLSRWTAPTGKDRETTDATADDAPAMYARPALATPYRAPQTPLEQSIANVWQKHLGIDHVGMDDNLFELQATSLDIVRVNGLLKGKLKKDIPVVTMFNFPTIGKLVNFLSSGKKKEVVPVERRKQSKDLDRVQNRMARVRSRKGR